METMRNLHNIGFIGEEMMDELERSFKDLAGGTIIEKEFYRRVGVTRAPSESKHGNKAASGHMEKKRKRKAQRRARKMSRARA